MLRLAALGPGRAQVTCAYRIQSLVTRETISDSLMPKRSGFGQQALGRNYGPPGAGILSPPTRLSVLSAEAQSTRYPTHTAVSTLLPQVNATSIHRRSSRG